VLLSFFFLRLLVFLQAAVAAHVAEHREHHLDGSRDQVAPSFHLGVDLGRVRVLGGGLDVLDNLDEEGVAPEFHDGEHQEEVDADEGSHGAVKAAEGLEKSHYLFI